MGLTNIISYGIIDYTGKKKTVPYFIPSGGTISGAQGLVDVTAPLIDLAIDGFIKDITMTIALDVPGGIKTAALVGNLVREGALIDFSADGTIYRWSTYFPSWKNTGFAANSVTNTGAFANVITDLNQFSDKYDNALVAYLEGVRTFRK
jgi:hypothetical protein